MIKLIYERYIQAIFAVLLASLTTFFKFSASRKEIFLQCERFNWERPLHVLTSNSADSTDILLHIERLTDLKSDKPDDCINCKMIPSLSFSIPDKSSSCNSVDLEKMAKRCSASDLWCEKWQPWRLRIDNFGQACVKVIH